RSCVVGAAVSTAGNNGRCTGVWTGDATAGGDGAVVAVSEVAARHVAGEGTVTDIRQGVTANGIGCARAATGSNSVSHNAGERRSIDTGDADALGTDEATYIDQVST